MTTAHPNLAEVIDAHYKHRATITAATASVELRTAVEDAIALLDAGTARIAEPSERGWTVNQWLKKAVLLYFRIHSDQLIDGGETRYFDRVPGKFSTHDDALFASLGIRVVPPATVRRGAYIGRGAVLMPSFVNIGAYVGERAMVDTWATVGSGAQIGAEVHLSGGVGIGGVLEPLQGQPTIIEDGCFIGARSEVVEGFVVGAGSVIAMGVFLGQSTKVYDRASGQIYRGQIPPGSVVVPGSLPSADGKYALSCAVIVKRIDAQTRAKTALNDLLRTD